MFAGSCIGVICLVISLEFLRRVQREYDGYLGRRNRKVFAAASSHADQSPSSSSGDVRQGKRDVVDAVLPETSTVRRPYINRATLFQRQFVRALIHMLQFGVAYFVMLMAMYYNGIQV